MFQYEHTVLSYSRSSQPEISFPGESSQEVSRFDYQSIRSPIWRFTRDTLAFCHLRLENAVFPFRVGLTNYTCSTGQVMMYIGRSLRLCRSQPIISPPTLCRPSFNWIYYTYQVEAYLRVDIALALVCLSMIALILTPDSSLNHL